MFAVPNGAYLSGTEEERAIQWNRLKSEGAVPGVSDLILAVPSARTSVLFIEMKRPGGGNGQSGDQREFQLAVESAGYQYEVIDDLDDFMMLVTMHMSSALI